jgi:uncharacterized protein YjiS (DUF1127 family)
MSTPFSFDPSLRYVRRNAVVQHPQSNSWRTVLEKWRTWDERSRQRAALRDIAGDPHLLADLGLTREEALDQANQPFWR